MLNGGRAVSIQNKAKRSSARTLRLANTKESFEKFFQRRFRLAMKQARTSTGIGKARMAKKLGVKHTTYCNYEIRAMLPVSLHVKFCELTGITLADLYYS
jgi:DNA-binding XRE family transcriptional regulator